MVSDRFRWVFCQLEILRNCLPQNVRRVLQELPASLDQTYEHILGEILKANPDQAYRLLQCLTVATRPLRVDELAEILALDFDGGKDGIPELNADWRWGNKQQGVLATCSSLIVVVEGFVDDSRTGVVQFAHFSVREFLTSDRLAVMKPDISKPDVSRFHIRLEPAHTIIAQSCLAILLQSDHDDGAKATSPLSEYASQHWVGHAHFGNVLSHIEYGMRRLFDPEEPYLTAWVSSHADIKLDIKWESFLPSRLFSSPRPIFTSFGGDDALLCLYYAALCGFCDLTRYLIVKNPQHVNATVGKNKSPLAAALRNRHIQVAELLRQYGAVLPTGHKSRTLLHAASADGMVDVAEWLLNVDADAPLHGASSSGQTDTMRPLIEHGADVHARDVDHSTPLHLASSSWNVEIMQLLIKHGADVHARDGCESTPLHEASSGNAESVKVLIKHGADVHAQDQSQWTPLHIASSFGNAETVQILIKHGADAHARNQSHSTPLHLASSSWNVETVQLLIEHGADVHARDESQSTPLHLASSSRGNAETVQLLIKHGADVHARDQSQSTPLHLASFWGNVETVQLLIKHGADVHVWDESQSTPLHLASSREDAEIMQLLIKHGADVDARDQSQSTPLHIASSRGNAETVQLLIEHGADVHAWDECQSTPLHMASSGSSGNYYHIETTVRLLIEHGASVNACDKNHQTPLHHLSSCRYPNADSLRLLLENGANVDADDDKGLIPFQIASAKGHHEIAQLLLDHRAHIVSNTR